MVFLVWILRLCSNRLDDDVGIPTGHPPVSLRSWVLKIARLKSLSTSLRPVHAGDPGHQRARWPRGLLRWAQYIAGTSGALWHDEISGLRLLRRLRLRFAAGAGGKGGESRDESKWIESDDTICYFSPHLSVGFFFSMSHMCGYPVLFLCIWSRSSLRIRAP